MGVFDGILGGALGAAGSIWNNERNIAFQRETNEHNEGLMREAWQREDTAVQRRSADMEAAGFNPVLATGAAASSMPAVRAEAPQARENVGASAVAGARQAMDISMTQAQIDAIRQDTRMKKVQADIMEGHDPITGASYTFMKLFQENAKTIVASMQEEEAKVKLGELGDVAKIKEARNKFFLEHGRELLDIELRMKKAGANQEEVRAALAEKTKEWYTADKIMGYISTLTGGFARVAGGAFMLDKMGGSGSGGGSSAADADLNWP